MTKTLLILTEIGMLTYWVIAIMLVVGWIYIPPQYMYSDYQNPVMVAWNWSFFPLDVGFAVTGLVAHFGKLPKRRSAVLELVSLSLMFCAGLMAVSFWALLGEFDVFWWAINVWLMVLAGFCLFTKFQGGVELDD